MKFLIDDANIDNIKEIYKYFAVDGVTTNPSILAASGKKPYEALREIREFIGNDVELHVQVISKTAEDMIKEGKKIVKELGINTYVKIPTTLEGLRAMKALSAEGYKITATTIYTPMQAYLVAKAGADYAAPYVNRIDNLGANGISATKQMHDIFKNNGFKTKILAASFKNSQQVLELCDYGVGASTVAPDIIKGLINNPSVSFAVDEFTKVFENICGEGKTMLDCE